MKVDAVSKEGRGAMAVMRRDLASPTGKRWGTLVSYALIGLVCGLPIAALYEAFLNKLAKNFAEDFEWLKPWYYWVLTVFFLWLVGRQLKLNVAHFRHLGRYPPTITAVVIALFLGTLTFDIWLRYWVGDGDVLACEVLWIVLLIVCVIFLCLRIWQERVFQAMKLEEQVKPREAVGTANLTAMPVETLISWLEHETPVEQVEHDLLDARGRAKRIWEALTKFRTGRDGDQLHQTVVLHGSFGSGKTSIVNFLEHAAMGNNNETPIFVYVSCWGFSSVAAQEHILEEAIEAVSQHVDCLGLTRLPPAYAAAIEKTSSWLSILADSFQRAKTPAQVLQQLTTVLEAINAQLVIIIEDSDRNAEDFDQRQIEAMLCNFREVGRVSFLLTAGDGSTIEFSKIAENTHFMTPLRPDVSRAVLGKVYDYCVNSWPDVSLSHVDGGTVTHGIQTNLFRTIGMRTWADALPRLVDTPRELKQIGRALISSWNVLHGEVSLEELLMVTTLRYAAPAVFTFLGTHLSELRKLRPKPLLTRSNSQNLGVPHPEEETDSERASYLEKKWEQAVERPGYDRDALEAILLELIPATERITGKSVWNLTTGRSQSINSDRWAIYWERISQERIGDELKDQDVISVVVKARNAHKMEALGKAFAASTEFANMVLFFEDRQRVLHTDDALHAAHVILEQQRKTMTNQDAFEIPILDKLADWIKRYNIENEKFAQWIREELIVCFPKHLDLANFLYFRLIRNRFSGDDSHMGDDLRKVMADSARAHYSNMDADMFASCFSGRHFFALDGLLSPDDARLGAEWLIRLKEWSWLAELLVESMKKHPAVIKPQVIWVFGHCDNNRYLFYPYQFSMKAIQEFFGARMAEVFRMLAEPIPNLVAEPRNLEIIASAQAEASKVAQQHSKSNADTLRACE
jgi:adenylate kinase